VFLGRIDRQEVRDGVKVVDKDRDILMVHRVEVGDSKGMDVVVLVGRCEEN